MKALRLSNKTIRGLHAMLQQCLEQKEKKGMQIIPPEKLGDYVQLLYEKKLVTYPRTDSRYLTVDMAEKVPDLCAVAAGVLDLSGEYPANTAQMVNDTKVSDHHALLPTAEAGRADFATLPTGERNILHMIAVRLLCAVGEVHAYTESAAVLECSGAPFIATGRTTLAQDWKAG